MSGNSTSEMFGLSSAIRRAPETGWCEVGRAEDVVRPVRHQERPRDLRHERREIHLLHREARLPDGVRIVEADDVADELEDVLPLGALHEPRADRLRRHVVGELVPRHRLGHAAPDAEERAPVEVGLRKGDVGAGRDRLLGVLRDEGDRDHAAHRGAVHEDGVEADCGEQRSAVLGPPFDRVPLAWLGRGAVAARVEREQPERLAEAVVDETEVVPAEEPAAELEDDRRVLRAGQLVVEPDAAVDLRVGQRSVPASPRSSRRGAS